MARSAALRLEPALVRRKVDRFGIALSKAGPSTNRWVRPQKPPSPWSGTTASALDKPDLDQKEVRATTAKAWTRPTWWSYSQYSTLTTCGNKYRLEKIAHVPETPAVWNAGGTAFHSTTEDYDRDLIGENELPTAFAAHLDVKVRQMLDVETDVSKWRVAGLARRTRDKPNGEDLDWWRSAGEGFTLGYAEWRRTTPQLKILELPNGAPAIEFAFRVQIGGVEVQGSIDRIFIDTNSGEILLVDLKTSTRVPESTLQLGVYRVAWEEIMGDRIANGAYFMARKGELTSPVSLAAFTKAQLDHEFATAEKIRAAGLFLPHRTNLCKGCGVAEYCSAVGGSKAAEYAGVV